MLLLSNMVLNTGTVVFFWLFAIFSGSFTYKYSGHIFCFAKPLTRKCSAEILWLKVAKLQLNSGILSQNCYWIFSLISNPVFIHLYKKGSKVREWFLTQEENTLIANDHLCDWNPEKDSCNGNWHFDNLCRSLPDSEDDFCIGCWKVSCQQQSFSGHHSPRWSFTIKVTFTMILVDSAGTTSK